MIDSAPLSDCLEKPQVPSSEDVTEVADRPRTYVIGRHPESDIVIKNPRIARQHAAITDLGAGHYHLTLRDSEADLAVLRDGKWEPVGEADLMAGDRIRLGDHVVTVSELFEPPPLASDVFISYSSADRERAGMIARTLEQNGWTVWWDQVIPPGKNYDEVIEEQVESARCVLVLWSGTSVASRWVRAEADDAMTRGALIPVLIENVSIPLVFRQVQAANLTDWHGEAEHPGVERLVAAVARALDDNPAAEAAAAPQAETRPAGEMAARTGVSGRQLTFVLLTAFAICAVWAIPGSFAREVEGHWLLRVDKFVLMGQAASAVLAPAVALIAWAPRFTMAQFWGILGASIAGVVAMVSSGYGLCQVLPENVCGTPDGMAELVLNMALREVPESLLGGAVFGYVLGQVMRTRFADNGGPGFMRRMIAIWMTTTTTYAVAIFLVISVSGALVAEAGDKAIMFAKQDARMVADTVMLGMTWALGLFLTFRFGPRRR